MKTEVQTPRYGDNASAFGFEDLEVYQEARAFRNRIYWPLFFRNMRNSDLRNKCDVQQFH